LISSLQSWSSFSFSLATKRRASSGHLENQSRVKQLISEGNWRHLTLKVSPTGDIHKQICRFSRTLLVKSAWILSTVSTIFFYWQIGLTPLLIASTSSGIIRFGIVPVLSKLFRFSMKASLIIWVSVSTNEIPWPSIPEVFICSFKISRKESVLKPLVISRVLYSIYRMKVHNLIKLCLPEPPTPISMMCPLGCFKTRAIRRTCSMASSKRTKFILFVLLMLYSSRPL